MLTMNVLNLEAPVEETLYPGMFWFISHPSLS